MVGSPGPLVPGCPGWFDGTPSTSVSVVLTVVKEGAEWVGRTSSATADIELRFRDAEDAGELASGRRVLTGTIRGQAPDMSFFPGLLRPKDVSVTVTGTGAATGALLGAWTAIPFSASMVVGRAVGVFRFRDSAGNVATCREVSVGINVPN
jgi:hypothetical protein